MKYIYCFLKFGLLKTILVLIILTTPLISHAQTRGNTTTISHEIDFKETLNSLTLDPSPLTGTASRVRFEQTFDNNKSSNIGSSAAAKVLDEAGIDVDDWVFDLANGIGDFLCSGISPEISATAGVTAGVFYQVHDVGTANLSIRYPVKVFISYPEKNSFACGDEVVIKTHYEIIDPSNTNKFNITAPFLTHEIGPSIRNMHFSTKIGLKAHWGIGVNLGVVKACETLYSFNESATFSISAPSPTLPPIVNICEGAFGPEANEFSLLACAIPGQNSMFKYGQSLLNTVTFPPGSPNYSFARFYNHDKVGIVTPDLPSINAMPTLPDLDGTFYRVTPTDFSFANLNGGRTLRVSGTKNQISKMAIDLVSLLDYANVTTSVSLGGDMGSIDAGDISPTFKAHQVMNFDFTPVVNLTVNLGATMEYTIFQPDGTAVKSGNAQMVEVIAGQYIKVKFPENCSEPVETTASSNLSGNLASLVKQEYYQSIKLEFGKIKGVLDLTLIETETPERYFDEKTIINHTQDIRFSGILSLPDFTLDPENPVITVASLEVTDVVNLGGGEKGVVYKIGIRNDGDVKLNKLMIDFNLANIFDNADYYSVECISSDELKANTSFDGQSDINLLAPENSLQPSETAFIELLVKVKPAISKIDESGCFETVIYNAMARAFGESPIGTRVENNFNQCTGERTGDDIVAVVDLGASVIESINDFTVYGWDEVKLSKPQGAHMGNVGSGGDIIFENNSLQYSDTFVIVGDIHLGGQLFLQGQSVVEADYVSLLQTIKNPNWKSSMIINGDVSEASLCSAVQPAINSEYNQQRGSDKVIVPRGQSIALPPGNYSTITLLEESELILTEGVYNITKWVFLGDNARVIYKLTGKKIDINLGTWQPLGKENLKFIINGPGSAEDVTYHYAGNQICIFHSSIIQGRIIAPKARVEFTNHSQLQGTCYAKNIIFKTGSSYVNPKFMLPLNMNPDCQTASVLVASEEVIDKNEETTSIGNYESLPITVFPNPASNHFTLSGLPANENIIVRIYNSLGREVYKVMNNNDLLRINIENEPAGLYYIIIEDYKPIKLLKM